MPVAVGFTVACSSGTAPGEDAIGDFTFRLSLNYGGDTIYVDIPVHGKKSKDDKENGDDTKDVAESAATAVKNSKSLSKAQKDNIKVQEDQGGPGNTLGRIVIDDEKLKSVDAACDDKGKLQIQIISWGGSTAGGRINLGEWSPGKRKWATKRKGAEPTEPPKPGTGNTYERFLDPSRKWRTIQGFVVIGIDGPGGAIGTPFELPYLDGLPDVPAAWALVSFDVVSDSPIEQMAEIERRLLSAGFDCRSAGGNLVVTGVRDQPGASINGLGITFATVPTAPGTNWEVAVRISETREFGLNLRPSSLSTAPIPVSWFGGRSQILTPEARPLPAHGGVLMANPSMDRIVRPVAPPSVPAPVVEKRPGPADTVVPMGGPVPMD